MEDTARRVREVRACRIAPSRVVSSTVAPCGASGKLSRFRRASAGAHTINRIVGVSFLLAALRTVLAVISFVAVLGVQALGVEFATWRSAAGSGRDDEAVSLGPRVRGR